MDPSLERYSAKTYSLLTGHWLIVEGRFNFLSPSEDVLKITGEAVLLDGSKMYLTEMSRVDQGQLDKIGYSYQFRTEDQPGFFRYDDASHGRPEPYHHKHEYGKSIRPTTTPPTLFEFLREVETTLAREF
jgi:hypothetical protein